MNKDKLLKMIPNMLTFLNGLLGITAVMLLAWSDMYGKVVTAAIMVACGAAVDFLDGHLARKFNATSDFGKQLDSFADLISFGIAPVFIMHYIADGLGAGFVMPVSIIYLVAAVYRLARYNVNDFSMHFMGLPITVSGVVLTGFCLAFYLWVDTTNEALFTAPVAILCVILSVLMVSKFKVQRV